MTKQLAKPIVSARDLQPQLVIAVLMDQALRRSPALRTKLDHMQRAQGSDGFVQHTKSSNTMICIWLQQGNFHTAHVMVHNELVLA